MKKGQNPFSVTFSRIPENSYIEREELEEIIDNFSYERPTEAVYKITGVRGSGKSVGLATIEARYRSDEEREKGWLVYSLNPTRDMLKQFATYLGNEDFIDLVSIHREFKVSLNLKVLTTEYSRGREDGEPDDLGALIKTMLDVVKERRMKVMVAVDEVSKTREMVEFAHEFDKWSMDGYPVYLVCTGLIENIKELGNAKNMTFFKRAPKVEMTPIGTASMTIRYRSCLGVDVKEAKSLAVATKGYAYAFQQLGVFYFSKKDNETLDTILEKLRDKLYENVYEKIWSDLLENERKLLRRMTEDREYKREELISALDDERAYSVYRDSLLKKGILVPGQYGYVALALPYFNEFIKEYGME